VADATHGLGRISGGQVHRLGRRVSLDAPHASEGHPQLPHVHVRVPERDVLVPPGRTRDPSAFGERWPLVLLALLGAGISAYLAAFQLGVATQVWDPVFGAGSQQVLTSGPARSLPVPDAALGTLGYLAEAWLGAIGGVGRWRRAPWQVLGLGLVATAMAGTGILLVSLQLVVIGVGCFLCLVSAGLSITLFVLAWPEVSASVALVRHGLGVGAPWRDVLSGAWARASEPDGTDGDPGPAGPGAGGPAPADPGGRGLDDHERRD
jgi:uncharacterized membrane protein